MATSPTSSPDIEVGATSVTVDGERLRVELSDGRALEVLLASIPWLRWLREASDKARANWLLEPGGFAVYWPDLDDGVEVRHLLSLQPLT
jgi:hypothetical protein